MMKKIFAVSVLLITISISTAQQKEQQAPQQIIELWFRYFNQLDGSEESTKRLVGLYLPDAMHQVGPSSRQIGPVFYEGHAAITKMAMDTGARYSDLAFRAEYTTANEKSVQLVMTAEGPWGGPAAAVEYVGAYTVKEGGKRYMAPGVAIFHLQNGKIRRVRLYEATSELTEVSK